MDSAMLARIRRLLDRDEIYTLCCKYMRGQDRLDAEMQRSVFHDDAYLDYGYFKGGPDEFVAFAQGVLTKHQSNQHLFGQADIEIEGDIAFGEIYTLAYHRIIQDERPLDLLICGRYIDRYERRNGVWKISFRSEVVDWARTDPASDDFFCRVPTVLRGARGKADLSSRRAEQQRPK